MQYTQENSTEIDFIKERYINKYSAESFQKHLDEYLSIKEFAPHGNINDNQSISEEAHLIMRLSTQYYLTMAFKAMRIDLQDPNVAELMEEGNIGTPGRIAKVWCGSNPEDDSELGGGRWSKSPRLADFPHSPSKTGIVHNIPITKRVDLVSNCSHHFIPFHTKARPDSYVIISYIPKHFKLGISKLQRITNHVAQRFWLQEDLTDALYEEISKAACTNDVYVGLFNIVHGCESLRGARSEDGSFTSEAYGGRFSDYELRKQVKGY